MAGNYLTLTSTVGTVSNSGTATPDVVIPIYGQLLQLDANFALGSNGFLTAVATLSYLPSGQTTYRILANQNASDGTVDAISITFDTTKFTTMMITMPDCAHDGKSLLKISFTTTGDGDCLGTLALEPRMITAQRVC